MKIEKIYIIKKTKYTSHNGYFCSLDKIMGMDVLNYKETIDNFLR